MRGVLSGEGAGTGWGKGSSPRSGKVRYVWAMRAALSGLCDLAGGWSCVAAGASPGNQARQRIQAGPGRAAGSDARQGGCGRKRFGGQVGSGWAAGFDAGQRGCGGRRFGGGDAVFCGVSHYAVDGDRGALRFAIATGGGTVYPDGGRTGQPGGSDRGLCRGGPGHDGDLGAGVFADAGEHRLCRDGGNTVRDRGRAARGTLHGAADLAIAGGLHAGAMGDPRRPPHHRHNAVVGAGGL